MNRLTHAAQSLLRRPWLLAALAFALLAAGSLGPGSYFLHVDTATQHVAAADLIRGCWGYSAATLAPMVLLAGPFAITGPQPLWEPVILTLLGGAMAAAVCWLIVHLGDSRRWGLLGGLWFLALPSILYYTRMHVGYALVFFTLGVALHVARRYLPAGVMLGLAITSHFNTVVPVALWLGWAFLFDRETRRPITLIKLVAGMALPIVVLEAARFLFTGRPFGWLREEIEDALRLSDQRAGESWPVYHLLRLMAYANGRVNLLLLLIGLGYPLVRRPRQGLADAVAAAGWSLIAFYSLRVSVLHNTFLTPRMFAAAYPLLAVTAALTLMRALQRIDRHLAERWRAPARQVATLAVAVLLPLMMLTNALDALAGSHTAYPTASSTVQAAAEAGLPVRYYGVFNAGLFFGQQSGATVNTNEPDESIVTGDHASVLIFEGAKLPVLRALEADPHVDLADYAITVTPHRSPYRPASIEKYGAGPSDLRDLWAREATPPDDPGNELVVWWPLDPVGEPQLREIPEDYVYLYQGGCLSPKPYGGGQKNYYDLLAEKATELWQQAAGGDLRGALQRVRVWLAD